MGRVDSNDRINIRGDIIRIDCDGHTGSDGNSRGARDTGPHGDRLLVDGGHDVVFDNAVRIVDDNLAATQDATGSRWQQEACHQAEAAQKHVNLSTDSITYYFRDMVKIGRNWALYYRHNRLETEVSKTIRNERINAQND